MSLNARSPARRGFAVLAAVIVLASPFAGHASAVDQLELGSRLSGLPASPICDPESGPVVWSRFSGIGSIHLGTGSYAVETVDIGDWAGSTGMARTFARSYDSGDFRRTSLGPGWMHNYAVRLRRDPTSRDLLFTLPSGSVERFKNARDIKRTFGNGFGYRVLTWDSEAGLYTVSDGPMTWTLDSAGTLVRGDNGRGDWVDVAYQNGQPIVSNGPDGGLGLHFETDSLSRLTRVVDSADATRFVDFEFDGTGRLIRAAPSGQPARVYAYDGDSERITTISDEDGAILESVGYDDRGWVIRQQDAQGLRDGEAVTLVYEDLPDGTIRTTVTYPPSLIEPSFHPVQIAIHDAKGRLTETTYQWTSTQTLIGRYGYDAQNRRILLQDPCAGLPTTEARVGFLQWIWLFFNALLGVF